MEQFSTVVMAATRYFCSASTSGTCSELSLAPIPDVALLVVAASAVASVPVVASLVAALVVVILVATHSFLLVRLVVIST
ncbi:unnamed protein product [Enterobius vermicularis]|uniref:Secreted peptide n=1 Tax=Enterobius vermicularis TaxID=51028 RepID=A0A0N4VE82_ENTVE|nr:unnamed protein product [Enterobius vermicularis]